MRLEKNVMIPMRDGVRLATDIYLPDAADKIPALINRTPYDKDKVEWSAEITAFVKAGFAVVVQDVRGRYHSEGFFVPNEHEAEDGITLFSWVREQPWSDGTYATFGRSYHGGTQWLAACCTPEGLKAMIPVVTYHDFFSGSAYQGGAKVLHDLRWTVASIIPDTMNRAREAGETVTEDPPEVYHCLDRIPLASDDAVVKYGSFYRKWLQHDTLDDYWKRYSPMEHYRDVVVPTLNISGWYDIFVPSTIRNYQGMRDYGGSEIARKNSRLIMGPWTHTDASGCLNGFDFGPDASDQAIDLLTMKVNWFDHWLKGKDRTDDPDRPVKIFVMGENRWRDEADWPIPGTQYVPYYFHSDGDARQKNGRLDPCLPGQEPSDEYVYDPMNPVPTIGGQVILPGENAIGPRDQRPAEQRPDVLVFETECLAEPVTVIGSIEARLYVSSDCMDTDFTVKLTDVDEQGISKLLTDGILRMRYRNSLESTELMEPGNIYEVIVDVAATANTFLKGHRIRVSVSSSNFPRFNRNSNSGGAIAFEEQNAYRPAKNTLYHDARHPSCLILPVIQED